MHDFELKAWRKQFASDIVGESREIVAALDTLHSVADTDCTILITGETGTGKELFARAAHRGSSKRCKQPFVAVNCAALPENLLEAELFGHIKGAFTGALMPRAGRFASANGGTLFLDEIGDLPLSAQAKLLRVLEERVVSPVGSDTDIPVDVRIVAATHRDLEDLVAQGKFRADLYFRLAVVPVHLPALRDRGDDILQIAELCLAKCRQRTGRDITGLDASARTALRTYNWPGNVRELAHRIERAALLTKTTQISPQDLQITGWPRHTPAHGIPVQNPVLAASDSGEMQALRDEELDSSLDLRKALENLEHTLIARALNKTGGNRTEAAALLGLNRTTLVEKLRKYAI